MDTETKKADVCLAGTVTVGPKGQVVIPATVRTKMNIKPGDKLIALYIPHKRAIGFVHESDAQHIINKIGARVNELAQ
jgi:AbrB family looped-hinge helix DNA binding protein